MSYSTDPERDAMRHIEALDAHNKAFEAQQRYYTEIVTEAFTKTIRVAKPETIVLPYADSSMKVQYDSITSSVTDMLAYGKPLAALMTVLKDSDCPHVAALRKAIADDYISSHVDWLAEVTA